MIRSREESGPGEEREGLGGTTQEVDMLGDDSEPLGSNGRHLDPSQSFFSFLGSRSS